MVQTFHKTFPKPGWTFQSYIQTYQIPGYRRVFPSGHPVEGSAGHNQLLIPMRGEGIVILLTIFAKVHQYFAQVHRV